MSTIYVLRIARCSGFEKMAGKVNRLNIIFMAHFHYPHGMASTKIVRNYIEYLSQSGDFNVKVLVLRQGRVRLADDDLCGEYKGVPYVTIGSNIRPGFGALVKGPKYYLDGMAYLKKNYTKGHKNILYVYGYPSTDNIPMIIFARISGYKIVFYLVEDIAFQKSSPDFLARLKNLSARFFARMLWMFADAVLVVSNHLLEKMTRLAKGRFKVALDPITVDFRNFDLLQRHDHDSLRVFYGGTFDEKDGVTYLIEAFEDVCKRHGNVELILTGKGGKENMEVILAMIAASNFRERILYKGFLPDADYYKELFDSDILCMTRTSSAFANAGFPFKLGEYLATGRPVIASDVSDVSLYLEDKNSAVIIEPDSPQAIADAIEYLLTNPDDAERIGANGKEAARKYFDVRVAGEKFKKLLIDL